MIIVIFSIVLTTIYAVRLLTILSATVRRGDVVGSNHDEGQTDRRGRPRYRRYSRRRRIHHDITYVSHKEESKAPWMIPEKFNGHGSFEAFVVQFQNCDKYGQ